MIRKEQSNSTGRQKWIIISCNAVMSGTTNRTLRMILAFMGRSFYFWERYGGDNVYRTVWHIMRSGWWVIRWRFWGGMMMRMI